MLLLKSFLLVSYPILGFSQDRARVNQIKFVGEPNLETKVKVAEIIVPSSDGTKVNGKATYLKDIRFSSKIKFPEDVYNANKDLITSLFPLGPGNYPMNETLYNLLRQSYCHSPVLPTDYEVIQEIEVLVNKSGTPNHAPAPEFWNEFNEVVDMQLIRRANGDGLLKDVLPWFPSPKLWAGFTLRNASDAVDREYPGLWQSKLLIQLLGEGLKIDNNIIPKRSTVQFLHGIVMLADINTWAVSTVGPNNFGAKYYVGRARPEEVAWAITNDLFRSSDLPSSVKNKVLGMKLQTPESFTAYKDGCPMHPSWPAMHGAASAMSFWLAVVADLTDAQWEETKLIDLSVAQARTIAGVHYTTDNISGLNLGQEVIAKALPRYLAEKYGADPIKVKSKCEKVRFRWEAEANRIMGQRGFTGRYLREKQIKK